MNDEKKEKERIRKQKWRQNLKKNPSKYNDYLKNKRLRKSHSKLLKSIQPTSSEGTASQKTSAESESAFPTKQSRCRSLKKADEHLPQSSRKKAEIIQNLASKYQIRVKLHENRGRKRKELSGEKKNWMLDFLSRRNMTSTNPGRKDVYINKVNGERMYLPRQYLLWTLRDLLEIINGTESNFLSTFSEKLTFSQLYDFIKGHKQFIFNNKIPHTSCLCDTCENIVLLAKGLNKKLPSSSRLPDNPHDIVEKYSCSSDSKECMSDKCENCSLGRLCQLSIEPHESESGSSSNSDNGECLVSFYRWETPEKHVQKIQLTECFDDASDRFKESIVVLKKHIYTKRAQTKHYNSIKESLDHGEVLVHVDFAESYTNSQQNEIQSAYFGNSMFNFQSWLLHKIA